MPPISDAVFKVWLVRPERARWLWLVVVGVLAMAPASFVLALHLGQPLLGLLVGPGLSLAFIFWYRRWMLAPATVQTSAHQLLLVAESAGADGSAEALLYSQLAYCLYTTYRGARLLEIYRHDDTRIRLRARGGPADLDALATLLQRRLRGRLARSG